MGKTRIVGLVLVLAGLAAAFWRVAADLVSAWLRDETYSHGLLMVPLALYVVWRQRADLEALPKRPSVAGLGVLAASLIALGAGAAHASPFLARLALLGSLAGIVALFWGVRHLKAVSFAFVLLLLGVPIPEAVFGRITFPLQMLAARFGEATLKALQIPVFRDGTLIVLANATLEVAEACSGIRSLVSLVALAAIWGYVSESPLWLRWLLAAASVPIAILANGVRVAGTGVAAHFMGPAAAQGFFHSFSGWLVFLVAVALLLALHRLALRLRPDRGGRPRC